MTYHIEWDNTEKTCIRIEFRDHWTWDDWLLGHSELNETIATVDHRVDIIECFYHMMPRGNAIPAFKYSGGRQPPNARHTVFVNEAGPVFRKMVDAVVGVMGWEGPAFVDNIPEARESIAKLVAGTEP